jgi:hypothetical protein
MNKTHTRALVIAIVALCCAPAVAWASTLTLRFGGTADLSVFGVSPTSTFEGSVTWDPFAQCGPGGGGEGDFPLSPVDEDIGPCVTATLSINAMSYDDLFDLETSRLMLFPDGMVLQLWFIPAVDLDGGGARDLDLASLDLFEPYDPNDTDPVFPDIGQLPTDLSFLSLLPERDFVFTSCAEDLSECTTSTANTLTVAPEPASTTLVLLGLSAVGLRGLRSSRPGTSTRAGDQRTRRRR